jgi:rRNA maturation protein Nop10
MEEERLKTMMPWMFSDEDPWKKYTSEECNINKNIK